MHFDSATTPRTHFPPCVEKPTPEQARELLARAASCGCREATDLPQLLEQGKRNAFSTRIEVRQIN
jgi:hypothetical protein